MIALAYSAIEESEYTALQAVLARQDAGTTKEAVS